MINGAPAVDAAAVPGPGPAAAVPGPGPAAAVPGPVINDDDLPPQMNGGLIIFKCHNSQFTINLGRQ